MHSVATALLLSSLLAPSILTKMVWRSGSERVCAAFERVRVGEMYCSTADNSLGRAEEGEAE